MPARVMLSSVTKDDLPLGDVRQLKDFWYQTASLPERLRLNGKLPKPETRISFTDTRSELQHHLEGKYGFEVFNFQNTPTDGGTPETETLRETHRSHFVIGLFDAQSGWKVPDQDPLTVTFREWRVALESPLGPATQLGDGKVAPVAKSQTCSGDDGRAGAHRRISWWERFSSDTGLSCTTGPIALRSGQFLDLRIEEVCSIYLRRRGQFQQQR